MREEKRQHEVPFLNTIEKRLPIQSFLFKYNREETVDPLLR
jgi:hypothetical protein